MDKRVGKTLLILFILTKGLVVLKSDLTIGIMVDTQLNLKSLSEAVDAMTSACNRQTSQGYHLEVEWAIFNSTNPTSIRRAVCGMIDNGIQAFVTALGCTQRKVVSRMAELFHIPHLSLDTELCPQGKHDAYTLYMTSYYKAMARVLADIAEKAEWKLTELNFDEETGYITRQHCLVQLSLAGIRTVLRRSHTEPGIDITMENRTPSKQHKTNTSFMPTKTMFVQNLTTQAARKLQRTYSGFNVLAIQRKSLTPCTGFAIGRSNHKTFLEVQFSTAVLMFYDVYRSLVETDGTLNRCRGTCALNHQQTLADGSKMLKQLKGVCSSRESKVSCQPYKPVEYNLFFIPVGLDGELVRVGHWTENKGLTVNTKSPDITNRLFRSRLTDFGGITLRVAVSGVYYPYSIPDDSGNTSYKGIMIDIMEDLSKKLNFRYTVTQPPDGQFGVNTNGTFSGMVGMVARGEADIGAASLTVNTERNEVVDFTTAFMQDSLGILTPKVQKAPDFFQIFKPFTPYTWLAILVTVLAAFVVFVFISSKSPKRTTENSNYDSLHERSVGENVLLIISSYFEQGPTFYPTSGSARCFLAFWFVFTLLTMAMYTAVLAAVLTVSTPVKPIDTLEDLAHRKDMRVLVEKGSNIWSLFKHSQHHTYSEIGSRLETTGVTADRFDLVKEGKACYISDRNYLEYVAAQSCGELRIANDQFYGCSLAFITSKNSPYKKALDLSLQKMVEAGLVAEYFHNSLTPRKDCPRTTPKNGEKKELGFDTLGGVFIIYLVITFISIIVLLIEMLRNHSFRNQSFMT